MSRSEIHRIPCPGRRPDQRVPICWLMANLEMQTDQGTDWRQRLVVVAYRKWISMRKNGFPGGIDYKVAFENS